MVDHVVASAVVTIAEFMPSGPSDCFVTHGQESGAAGRPRDRPLSLNSSQDAVRRNGKALLSERLLNDNPADFRRGDELR